MSLALAVMFTVIAVAACAALLAIALVAPWSPFPLSRHVPVQAAAVPAPEPRTPRDTSRAYPRPKGSRSKLNRVCPVCGTGSETGDLDRRVLGWPAHRTCAEWLGDWHPRRPDPPPYKPDRDLIGYMEQGQKPAPARTGGTNTVVFTGKGAITAGGGGGTSVSVNSSPGAQINVGDRNIQVSLNEARDRLDREIIASWGVPPLVLQEHTHKVGDPLPAERCPKCGAQFVGTPDYLRMAFKTHLQVGCRTQGFEIG